MKKLLLVLAIGAFAACGDGSSTDESTTADTTSTSTVDTNTTVAPMPDTTAPAMTDSSAVRPDSAAQKK